MYEINKKIKYVDKDGFLFIGRNEKRKNLKLFIKLAEFYESKSRFKVITNKISDNNCSELSRVISLPVSS